MCLNIKADEYELGDLNEPANYKAALLDHESNKWLNAMNVEMKSMKDNEVWDLVDLPPNGNTIGSKCLFKKKTDMDRAVHSYKAHLVAKGYTKTLRINYEETFSHVADIRAIRILIAIYAFNDYEIWQMDVKIAFHNGYLSKEVYMEHPEGLVNPKFPNRDVKSYIERCFAMKDLGEAAYILGIKIYRDRSKRLIAVGSFMYALRCTRPDVAFPQNITSRFQKNPGDIKRELRVSCYTDVGYLTDADDLNIFATSSAEVEYIAALDASKEAVWVRKFISGLGVVPRIEEPIKIYCDNTGAITIANESGITKGARHYHAKFHYLREVIEFGDVKIEKVHKDDNLADPLLKLWLFLSNQNILRI
ncbi:putative retrotransposon ty1-copia subclass protein [Tanacetum coccineum]